EGISGLLSTCSHPVLPGGLAGCPGGLLGPRDKPSLGRSQERGKNKEPMIWEHTHVGGQATYWLCNSGDFLDVSKAPLPHL
ncbi:unnamed protein product, partial [Gulo gulo]